MSSEDFKKDFNIYAKLIYREWLMEAIEHDAYESFKDCVLNLGTEWHVIRTVKKENQKDFCKNLWNNRKNIQNGTYNWWTGAPSYKSKVCFLINPQYYKFMIAETEMRLIKKTASRQTGRMLLINIMKNIKKNFIN